MLRLCELVPDCDLAADIGTDHGYLGCALLQTGKCRRVWFTDISADSLGKAERLIHEKGLESQARFFVGDGLEPLPYAPNAIIIAGMGGHTISGILDKAADKTRGATLVLGANTKVNELRRFLSTHGCVITEECAVSEAGRFYVLMRAESGSMRLDEEALEVGPVLAKKHDEDTLAYFQYRYNGAKIALERASQSPSADLNALRKEIQRWQKLI